MGQEPRAAENGPGALAAWLMKPVRTAPPSFAGNRAESAIGGACGVSRTGYLPRNRSIGAKDRRQIGVRVAMER